MTCMAYTAYCNLYLFISTKSNYVILLKGKNIIFWYVLSTYVPQIPSLELRLQVDKYYVFCPQNSNSGNSKSAWHKTGSLTAEQMTTRINSSLTTYFPLHSNWILKNTAVLHTM